MPNTKLVAVNKCYGGFSLSAAAIEAYAARKGITLYPERGKHSELLGPTYWTVPEDQRTGILTGDAWHEGTIEERQLSNQLYSKLVLTDRDIARDDPDLIAVIQELGPKADGSYAKLSITEIPDDVDWEIGEYDGQEWVQEKHRTW
jgi:hypothetical protein